VTLSPEEIRKLLAKPARKRGGARPGTTGIKGKKVDVDVRDYQTWFKLQHEIFDKSPGVEFGEKLLECENPNCQDPRRLAGPNKSAMVARVNGRYMCRFCFLDGWLLKDESQLTLDIND